MCMHTYLLYIPHPPDQLEAKVPTVGGITDSCSEFGHHREEGDGGHATKPPSGASEKNQTTNDSMGSSAYGSGKGIGRVDKGLSPYVAKSILPVDWPVVSLSSSSSSGGQPLLIVFPRRPRRSDILHWNPLSRASPRSRLRSELAQGCTIIMTFGVCTRFLGSGPRTDSAWTPRGWETIPSGRTREARRGGQVDRWYCPDLACPRPAEYGRPIGTVSLLIKI
ncbi:hypothetical protein GGS23DRAFT_48195 [Durotheca rogersii]|uniref:uncharacterized protein n=1 Tax=Durotheca rogersii TaxID=419775 RepID=UPI00221EB2D7|nr:uncharacterized protein GGS23DRAFT_48195 [Durotheca rogersii]KAI5863015.1 hypothetical protein GGS23DRAFT_48195 [Durotheca rogersii]